VGHGIAPPSPCEKFPSQPPTAPCGAHDSSVLSELDVIRINKRARGLIVYKSLELLLVKSITFAAAEIRSTVTILEITVAKLKTLDTRRAAYY